jgi:putative FmdB family regulatory protein
MPTYEYRCKECNHQLEEFQSITAKPLRKCPRCGKNGLQRLIGTGAGVVFKGSGFWQTDYRSENYKKAAESEKKSNDSKSDGKTTDQPSNESKKSKENDSTKETGKNKNTEAN